MRILHPIERNVRHALIGGGNRALEGRRASDHGQDAATGGHELIVTKSCAGVQDGDAGNVRRALEAADRRAGRHGAGITGRGQHHADGYVLA